MRKILYISGTRADYGLIKDTLLSLKRNPKLEVEIAATGMHLMTKFGKTIREIKKDGFKVHLIEAIYKRDNRESMVKFIGEFILNLLKKIKKVKPDIIFVQGDRIEMLGAAIVGTYLRIPVAHSHGGEVTSTVDEIARHAITKLSHIHFVSTKRSAQRIKKMGEDSWRVFITGAPGLDVILRKELLSPKEIAKKYKLNLSKPIILVLQHPVIAEEASQQMKESMEAIKEIGLQTIVIYPSADPGGREMINIIEKYKKYPFIQIYKNIGHKDFLSLMKTSTVLVGNSSSGIIEAPSFYLPVVNIGERQEGREKTDNVIDVGYDKDQIKKAIFTAIHDKNFREKVRKCKNPYGDGKAGQRIANILSKIKIERRLLEKQVTY
jgi:UDP-hydrolysing UDP-N-acetyl-D-glucosamine 2-epimerase